MADTKRVTLRKADEELIVEVEADDSQQAMALAEAGNPGWRAVGASSVFTNYSVTLVKDGDYRTLSVRARDVMGAKAIAEQHLDGYEMTMCSEA